MITERAKEPGRQGTRGRRFGREADWKAESNGIESHGVQPRCQRFRKSGATEVQEQWPMGEAGAGGARKRQ